MERKDQNRTQNAKGKTKFPSKNIKHDPQAESARAKFGLRDSDSGRPQ